MRIIKVFNNNVILAEDEKHNKKILSGRGIGFQKHKNDYININDEIELFVRESKNPEWMNSFLNLINEIPFRYILTTRKIIENAEKNLQVKFNPFLLISLSDHIYFATIRAKKHNAIAIMDDVRNVYPSEYKEARNSLQLINKEIQVSLDENEANFLAIHFVENELAPTSEKVTIRNPMIENKCINDLLKVITDNIGFPAHATTLSRLTIHLRFLLRRIDSTGDVKSSEMSSRHDNGLYNEIKQKYPELIAVESKIIEYLKHIWNYNLSDSEKLYLLIHLHQITEDADFSDSDSDE
ncbi:PRD domain-containing protein [Ligilactobacillus sp. WILCCON 0076]|uniref:PRD domain-containing protein n=1 Tax=Ligilactobacillus ubinensis TaxID=2876789 RepID=A0A9X2FN16_9LACO|nr:PRD domain-containing protein [Ligilactobacillus ubinensis]MCP0888040.1 PRD domain-containing protein [Ligilactobacillus ubinensis]